MLLAIAVLLIHPQIAPQPVSAEKVEVSQTVNDDILSAGEVTNGSLPLAPVAADMEVADVTIADTVDPPPVESTIASLPDAPLPALAIPTPAPTAFLANPAAKPMTVSVDELHAEASRKDRIWMGLGIAAHSAATFDAWTTRHEITTAGAQEMDPLLKPFATNPSLYLAIQVGPALMDYAAKKMMYSKYSWMRRMWWAPQAASTVASLVCGAHNLAVQ